MKPIIYVSFFYILLISCTRNHSDIPLPEHPRPDFQRTAWMNLNGSLSKNFC
jgi:hypothetical protein